MSAKTPAAPARPGASGRTIVTLDGPAGVGKTTLARRLAAELAIPYLDTGAMFRGVAWKLGDASRQLPPEELAARLAPFRFALGGCGADSRLTLNDEALPEDIRSEKVGLLASNLATLQPVRDFLKAQQQAIGRASSLVAEGRDMGTVVFPEASHKFFLDATPEERGRRRTLQLREAGQDPDQEEITLQIKLRDAQDRNRPIAPLRPAEDAVIVDTTGRDVDAVFKMLLEYVHERR